MTTKIKAWQIINENLEEINTSMKEAGKKETEDLEKWITSHPSILGNDILLIGEQVQTKSGPMDFLGINDSGDLIVVELKRDKLPRRALAQAIDYASDIASWDLDEINEVCKDFTGSDLEDYLNENFTNLDIEDLVFNQIQKILLVGFSVEESLQRMIEWLSDSYGVSINIIILKYLQTKENEEIIARTMAISEEVEKERSKKRQFKISMSDEPGNYEFSELKKLLRKYLTQERETPRRMREIILPLLLEKEVVTRDNIKEELVKKDEAEDKGKAGIILTTISREMGVEKRDYLRQVIQYERPTHSWEKDNYKLVKEYKEMIEEILEEINI